MGVIRAIRNLHKDCRSAIVEARRLSQEFPVTTSLRQGAQCSLAPTLFKIYLEESLVDWRRKCGLMGVPIENDSYTTYRSLTLKSSWHKTQTIVNRGVRSVCK